MSKGIKSQVSLQNEASQTSQRKQDHIRICLEKDIEFKKSNGFEKYEFEHWALPELNLSDIDTSTTFLGKKFKFPFFIEALTGGSPGTEKILNQDSCSHSQLTVRSTRRVSPCGIARYRKRSWTSQNGK